MSLPTRFEILPRNLASGDPVQSDHPREVLYRTLAPLLPPNHSLDSLTEAQRRTLNRTLGGHLEEFLALGSESDSALFHHGLYNLARRLEDQDHLEIAQLLYAASQNGTPISTRARGRLDAIQGAGDGWSRAEFLGRRLAAQASDPAALFGMFGAGLAFRVTRLAALTRLAATPGTNGVFRALRIRTMANLAGFGVEVPTFGAATRLGNAALGREQDWSLRGMGSELASGAIVLGSLKVFGGIFGMAANRLGNGRAGGAIRELPLQLRLGRVGLHQGGMLAGIMTGHHLESVVGLRPHLDNGTTLVDSLSTLLQFNVAGRLTHGVFGGRYQSAERELEFQTRLLSPDLSVGAGRVSAPEPGYSPATALGFPSGRRAEGRTDVPLEIPQRLPGPPLQMMMAMSGGGGSRGPGARSPSPHLARVRDVLDRYPRLKEHGFEELGFHLFEDYAGAAGLPLDVWLGRALSTAPPEVVELWLDFIFNPQVMAQAAWMDPMEWLRKHHIHGGLRRVRRSLQDPDGLVRVSALHTLAAFLGQGAIPELLERLVDPNLEVRVGASDVLMRLGINAPQRADRLRLAAEEREEIRLILSHVFRRPSESLEVESVRPTQISPATLQMIASRSTPDLIRLMEDSETHPRIRGLAIEQLAERGAEEAVPHLREIIFEEKLEMQLLRALDRIRPDWDQEYRRLVRELMPLLSREWLSRDPQARWPNRVQEALDALDPKAGGGVPPSRMLTACIFGGAGLAGFLDPEIASAASRAGEISTHGSALGMLAGLSLLIGAAVIRNAAGRRPRRDAGLHERPTLILEGRGGEGSRSLPPVDSGPPLGSFESLYDSTEVFTVPRPAAGQEGVIGRSTRLEESVFPDYYRNIGRRHLDFREVDGILQVRAHQGSRGVRINHHNLDPLQWYVLNDGDIVEFVSESRADLIAWKDHPEQAGQIIQGSHRLGDRSLRQAQGNDQAALFRFRRMEAPPEAKPPTLLEQMFRTARRLLPAPAIEPPPAQGTASQPPPAAPHGTLRDAESFLREIRSLSDKVQGSINIFEAGLRYEQPPTAMLDVLQGLIRVHQKICGNSQRVVAGSSEDPRQRVHTVRLLRVPNWDGVVLQRLQYFSEALTTLEAQDRASSLVQSGRQEIGALRDRFNRLYEIVRMYRRFFTRTEEHAVLDAIERAYHGLRPPPTQGVARVRSDTRSLDAAVRQREREAWTRAFIALNPPSRAVINMRILLGEIDQVRGRPVLGNFYRALARSTLYEGMRSVHVLYDMESGELVGFNDGSPEVQRRIQRLVQEGRRLEEIGLLVDAVRSGRIVEVTGISPNCDDSIRHALEWLRVLQVLPESDSFPPPPNRPETGPREISGSTELDPSRAAELWSILIHPPGGTERQYLRRVEAVTPFAASAGPDGRPEGVLLTLEGYERVSESSEAQDSARGVDSIQLWIRSEQAEGINPGDVVAISRRG